MAIKILVLILLLSCSAFADHNDQQENEETLDGEQGEQVRRAPDGAFTTSQGVFTSTLPRAGAVRHNHEQVHSETIVVPTIVIPPGFIPVAHQNQNYYYSRGAFYQLIEGALTPVAAPIGIEVPQISTDYETVDADGKKYYYLKGIYYIKTMAGYQVVHPPALAPATQSP